MYKSKMFIFSLKNSCVYLEGTEIKRKFSAASDEDAHYRS